MKAKPLKTELHHWWPRTLAEHWRDEFGSVTMIRRNGETRRAPAGAFGAVTNAHHIKMGGPWDSSFEPVFNMADYELSGVVRWLLTLEAPSADRSRPRLARISPQMMTPDQQQQLVRTVASLITRSPRTRDEIRRTTQYYRERFGLADPRPEDHLIAFNQSRLYDAYCRRMGTAGRWAVLFSDSTEFVFGDGFVHNFIASVDDTLSGKKCVLPLTPTVAIVYMLPMSYPSEPKLVSIKLDDDEVQFLNDALQAYANDFLFFRSQEPRLSSAFTQGGHRQFEYHSHPWLEEFLDDLSQYNLWGPGGTPGRSEGYFLKSLEEGARFDALLGDST